jgi:Cupredoxin-like domain
MRLVTSSIAVATVVGVALLSLVVSAHAAEVRVSYKNKQFQPAEISAPANTAITIRIKNLDPQPMEFESNSLRVEKVVTGNGEGVVNVRPLQPGRYEFFDDFNDQSRGALTVK